MSALTSERFVQFIDNDGCRDYRTMVKGVVGQDILPNIPCMIAIDHSLTGGVIDAISDYYGRNNISLIVMDSHTDAIPMSVMAGAIHYDLETNPNSLYDPDDKLLYNRTDSYNASSFLDHILQEQLLDPSHVYLLGVSDFPPKKAFKIKDPRIQRYTSSFVDLKRKGLKIFTKEECIKFPSRISQALTKIKTPYVYLSIDMDIGAGNALEGVRFRNWKGLNQKQIEKLLMIFLAAIEPKQLVGMDLTEFNPRRAGQIIDGTHDGTYEIAATLIENIVRKIAL
jgi:arginase family enzyme